MAEMAVKVGEGHVVLVREEDHTVDVKKNERCDWFPCSVLGYLLCPLTGICAIYYAVRANYTIDRKIDEAVIDRVINKARTSTLLSIIVGVIIVIIVIVVMVENPTGFGNKSLLRLINLYKP